MRLKSFLIPRATFCARTKSLPAFHLVPSSRTMEATMWMWSLPFTDFPWCTATHWHGDFAPASVKSISSMKR